MKYEVWFKRSQECYAGIFNAKDRDDAIDQAVDKEKNNPYFEPMDEEIICEKVE